MSHSQIRYQALETSEIDVRSYGDVAPVRDVQTNHATYGDQEVRLQVRVGQVRVKQRGDWRLVSILSPMG